MKKFKLLFLGFLLLGISFQNKSFGQQLLHETFSYPLPAYIGGNGNAGSTSNNWTTHSVTAGQTTTIDLITGNLSYTGLQASAGNKLYFFSNANATSRDVNRPITTTSTVCYFSALVNIVDNSQLTTTGDYFIHFGATAGSSVTIFGARFGAKSSGTGFRFCIQNTSGGSPTYTDNGADLVFGTTYLIVVKYDRSTSPTTASFWVNPTSLGGTEPAGSFTNTSGTGSFATFASICLRENATTPKVEIDEIRVGTTWASVTPNCTAAPAQPSTIAGLTSPCETSSQNYSVTNELGVDYTWAFPTGWTQTSGGTTNTVTVTVGNGSGNITVTPSNPCGSGTAQTLAVSPSLVPAQPGTISGATTPCFGASENYSVTNEPGTTYNWVLPTGWIQTGGGTTNIITVTVGSGNGNITITPSNSCGNGTIQTLAVTHDSLPSQPGSITGSTSPCIGTSENYSVTSTAGVSYTWSLPTGWTQTGGGTTNSITVTVGNGSGNISVAPSNSCGNGTEQTLAVSPITVPEQPSSIVGPTTPLQNSSQVYSVTNVAGVNYNWTFPADWTQTAGGNTNSVTLTIGLTAGDVTCTPSNLCGNGTPRTLYVTPQPNSINVYTNNNNISVFPNPTNGKITIFIEEWNDNMELKLLNIQGKKILTKNYSGVSGISSLTIDLSDFPDGLYLIQINSPNKTYTQKILKQ